MGATEFGFEFHSEISALPDYLKEMTEVRLRKLGANYRDMTGASVAVRGEGTNGSPKVYTARIVVYVRPENVAVTEKEDSPEAALRQALDAVERKIRKLRDTKRDRARGRA